ncbi:lytic murein transglycosylase [Roseicyclus sp. F158]|uniref:Lytic murein transglycosylase n=1 Tax=Tropicimonas omnivorans TaxID=3075590 RepID=A0ABU3DHR4_9RHOB|nr:lytic murein transglycosylase [Roseicyclus sp. F158]MDT0683257.1 lytic murein transglycosylase [Roseicyclus sp. F158]
MAFTRRIFLAGAGAATLAGCSSPALMTRAAVSDEYRPVPNAAFDRWLAAYRGRAAARGISEAAIAAGLRNAGYLPGVVERDRAQTEFKRSFEDYIAIVASEEKVAAGRAAFARQHGTLQAIEAQYGVPAETVAAFWGVESSFGTRRGDIPVTSAVATLAFDGRRGAFFEDQLDAALRILARGDTTPANLTGSWAGAMGHTQFIPTSYQAYAVDFTGDGRRDIWSENPADALASTAAYLTRSGWQRGGIAAVEVPAGTGGPTVQPDGRGPVFRLGPNFDVIKRYNNSNNYALAVAYLSGRIAGQGPLSASFGPDATGLTQSQRRDLQQRLTARGFDTGGADGVIGPKSEEAIRAYQQSRGLEPTGRPSPALLASLR